MHGRTIRLIACCAVVGLCFVLGSAVAHAEKLAGVEIKKGTWRGQEIEYLEGQILVGLKAGKTQSSVAAELGKMPVQISRNDDGTGFMKLQADPGQDLFALIDKVAELKDIAYAEPNMVTRAFLTPNDSYFANQWSFHNTGQSPPGGTPDADIDAVEGWDLGTGSPTVRIGVLDSGIPIQGGALSHPELDDPDRFILGPDYIYNDAEPQDGLGHGTHVTGTIAAESNNAAGVAGVAWNVEIMALQVFDNYGYGTFEAFRDACYYATDNGCHIINYSGGGGYSSAAEAGVAYAQSHGVLICAAAGNNNHGSVIYPAALSTQYDNVIAVSSTDHNDVSSSFSSIGPEVTVSAPGGYGYPFSADDIYSTLPNYQVYYNAAYGLPQNYAYLAGTSMACPHVSGLAGLVLSLRPGLSPQQVRDFIKDNAEDLGAPGFDNLYGWGRINVYNTLTALPDAPHVTSVTPAQNARDIQTTQVIIVWFDQVMNGATINSSTFKVHGSVSGPIDGTLDFYGSGVVFTPTAEYAYGEQVSISLNDDIQSAAGLDLVNGFGSTFTVEACGYAEFGSSLEYATGDSGNAIAAADFNGDYWPDLAVSSQNKSVVSILLNDGSGGYPSHTEIYLNANRRPMDISAADFDGDGDIDLLTPNYNTDDITPLLNDGNGNFTIGYIDVFTDIHGGSWPADMNNDGKIDIIVTTTNPTEDYIIIGLNLGNGTFTKRLRFDAPDSPYDPHAVDLNNDGYLDMACVGAWGDALSVYINTGTTSFTRYDYSTDSRPVELVMEDLNGDSYPDIAVANRFADNVQAFFNDGTGQMGAPTSISVGMWPVGLIGGDFDGDGDIDLATMEDGDMSVSVLTNDGTGAFTRNILSGFCSTQTYCSGFDIATADLDQDNSLDLVIPNMNLPSTISVMTNYGLPPAPVLYSPVNGKQLTAPVAPHLNCNDVPHGLYYHFQIDDAPDFATPLYESQYWNNVSEWDVPAELGAGTYYWRARAATQCGFGDWSEVWHIVVVSPPPPSCPVLYVRDGIGFVEDNPLLTACEASGYIEEVEDYYIISQPVDDAGGTVSLQLRELEDEITYLRDFELLAVDHEAGATVGFSGDGSIMSFERSIAPTSAVDDQGVDQLAALAENDDLFYTTDRAGSLTLTFPAGEGTGIGVTASSKPPCIHDPVAGKAHVEASEDPTVTVELLTETGAWVEIGTVAPRANAHEQIVYTDPGRLPRSGEITMRISWDRAFTTDAVRQFVPSNTPPALTVAEPRTHTLVPVAGKTESVVLDPTNVVEMKKGDVMELTFDVPATAPGSDRTYIVRAVGRYQPDYGVYSNLLPNDFQLYNAYPNPFNPTTTIQYDIPHAARVRLEIFNVLGQSVATLVDENQAAGHYEIRWDATAGGASLASGVYMYRLTADDFTETRKMTLLK